jgi:hypothetical protein
VFGFVGDNHTFNMFNFMKNWLQNQLSVHLDLCSRFYNQQFFTLQNFPYDQAIAQWQGKTRYSVNA